MRVSWCLVCVLWLGLASGIRVHGDEFRGLPRTVPRHGRTILVQRELMPAEDRKAACAFKPTGAGVRDALVKQAADGRRFILLPVNFQEGNQTRLAWDAEVKADWSGGESVVFDFIAGSRQDVLGMSLYVRSVNGWYVANFGLDSLGEWNRIVLDKGEFATEGQPQGWHAVDRVRISCWRRGDRQDGWLGVANLGVSREPRRKPKVAIVRGDTCAEALPGEGEAFGRFAAILRTSLEDIRIASDLLSDRQVSARVLRDYKLVLLPYNPRIPDALLESLRDFIARGGKVLAFYDIPLQLQRLLKISMRGWGGDPQGAYGGFLATEEALPGQPEFVPQASCRTRIPGSEGCRVIATWADGRGKDTMIPAAMLTPHGAYVSHVWLVARGGAYRRELLEALVGALMPIDWVRRLKGQVRALGALDGHGSWHSLAGRVRQSGNARAASALEAAGRLRGEAWKLLEVRLWKRALPLIRQAQEQVKTAYFLTQRGARKRQETRLAWCHQAAGIAGWDWDRSIRHLADCGFNGILANMCWAGAAYYDSQVLPRREGNAENYLRQCLEACRKYGVQCHVWKVCFNMGGHASKAFEDRMVREGRVQVSRSGKVNRRWLCPTHPLNRQDEIDAMVELARRYPQVAGVHLDYIRFSSRETCYCDGCRKRFEEYLGKPLEAWPFDLKDGALLESWRQFRRRAISLVVESVHRDIKRLRPDMRISAAVFSNWPEDRNTYGQDWGRWCRRGWLDFVCPMDYRDDDMSYRALVKLQREWCHETKLYPGIGLSCWEEPGDPYRLVRQIDLVRRLRLDGFAVFSYDVHSVDALNWCGMGSTK